MKDMQSVIVAAWPWHKVHSAGRSFEVDLNLRKVLGYQFTYFWVPSRAWGMQSA